MILAHLVPRAAAPTAWDLEPFALAAGAISLALYARGWSARGSRAVTSSRAWCFVAGVAVAVAATVSPLHAAADATFTGHMAQHILLLFAAAPLVVAGRPGLVMALALPTSIRGAAWRAGRWRPVAMVVRAARSPVTILLVFAAALWIWHLPGPYQAAIRSEPVHALEHATLLTSAMAFWAGVTRTGPRRRVRYAPAMGLVVATMLHSTWLAAILTFGDAYPLYARRAAAWGVDPLHDQQMAGSFMWVVPAIAYLAVLAGLFVRWLHALDERHPRTWTQVETP